jgi:hypothetical protein
LKIYFTPFIPIILLKDNINVKKSNFRKLNTHPSFSKFFKHPASEQIIILRTQQKSNPFYRPGQAEGSRRLRLPDFKTIGT